MRSFLKWAERLGFVARNSLAKVEMLRVQGRQKRARRAYVGEEIQRLLAVAPKEVTGQDLHHIITASMTNW